MNDQPDDWAAKGFAEMRAKRGPLLGPPIETRPGQKLIEKPLMLELLVAATLAGKPVPERRFLDAAHLFPEQNVVLLGGDGGTGKSLLALQLALAVATGNRWIGIEVSAGPVLYLSAEDSAEELHIRLSEICAAEAISLSEAYTLNLVPLVGEETALVYEKSGRLVETSVYSQLDRTMAEVSPALVVIDNIADAYNADENNRGMVKSFVSTLRRLAVRHDSIVLLLGHPSVSGMQSGSGLSGSTAWNNSARVRLYLTKPDGQENDNARVLEVKKANYSGTGTRYGLVWKDGCFVRQDPKSAADYWTVADMERCAELLGTGKYRQNEAAMDWGGYVVAEVLDLDIGRGIPAKKRTPEQNRHRDIVRTALGMWVRGPMSGIGIVEGLDAKREPTLFYGRKERGA